MTFWQRTILALIIGMAFGAMLPREHSDKILSLFGMKYEPKSIHQLNGVAP